MKKLRQLYEYVMELAGHKHAIWFLAAVSFLESSVFPIPPDVMLIPMILADRSKAWIYAIICTICSVSGGLLGYAIGYLFYDTIGEAILNMYHMHDKFDIFQSKFKEHGALIIIGAGLTPFPYKIITIASGVAKIDLAMFVITSIIGRIPRFFLLAALLWKFGEPIKKIIDKYFGLLSILFFVILVAGFASIKFLF